MSKIDRQALDLLESLQKQINTFYGIRHLWAESVANHRPVILTEDELMQKQRNQIASIAYDAMRLIAHTHPGFSPHTHFKYIGADLETILNDYVSESEKPDLEAMRWWQERFPQHAEEIGDFTRAWFEIENATPPQTEDIDTQRFVKMGMEVVKQLLKQKIGERSMTNDNQFNITCRVQA